MSIYIASEPKAGLGLASDDDDDDDASQIDAVYVIQGTSMGHFVLLVLHQ